MKNLQLLPEHLQEIVRGFRYKCGCGQEGLCASVTKKGSVQLHCPVCGRTFFFNDPQVFALPNIFACMKQTPVVKKMKGGGLTRWYPKARVREFVPEKR